MNTLAVVFLDLAPCSRISASIFTSLNRPRASTRPAVFATRQRLQRGNHSIDVRFDVDAGSFLKLPLPVFRDWNARRIR